MKPKPLCRLAKLKKFLTFINVLHEASSKSRDITFKLGTCLLLQQRSGYWPYAT